MDDKIILSMYQGGMHLTMETSRRILEKMTEIRKRNPQQWERKDLDLMEQAEKDLGII
ncbi:MAG: hypothetical protein IJR06_02905 [Paludibacteraceae bacterium]|nr:hypothetical protein [Paludibacteraceae bacterium]